MVSPTPFQPEPQRRHFHRYDRIGIEIGSVAGRWYRPVESNGDGHIFEPESAPTHREFFTHERIADLEVTPGWRYSPDWYSPGAVAARQTSQLDSLAFVPKKDLPAVLWKSIWVKKIEALKASGHSITDASLKMLLAEYVAEAKDCLEKQLLQHRHDGKAVVTKKIPKIRTLWRWLKAYEKGGRRPQALRPKFYRVPHDSKTFDPAVEALIHQHIHEYASEKRPTQQHQYGQLKSDVAKLNEERAEQGLAKLDLPCFKVFHQRIGLLSAFEIEAGRYGTDAAIKKFAFVSKGLDVTYPGQRIEMDHWRIQLHTILIRMAVWDHLSEPIKEEVARKRWYLSLAIDASTRCVLGLRLTETANTQSAVDTLMMIVSDKRAYADAVKAQTPWNMRCGITTIAVDMGSEYISDDFRYAATAVGATIVHPPAGQAQMRARVERMFRTADEQLLSNFTGRSFSGVEDLAQYPAMDRASITVEQFGQLLVRYVLDIYHNQPHGGLGGQTPYNAWQEQVRRFGTVPPPDGDTIRHVFGITLSRKVTTKGIRVLNIFYQSPALHDYLLNKGFGKAVDVKLNPANLGAISVNLEGRYLTVPAVRDEFEGLRAEQWIAALADLRRRFGEEAEIGEAIALAAMRDIRQAATLAEAQVNIATTTLTSAEIDRAERKIRIAWKAMESADAAAAGDDILSNPILPTTTSFAPSTSNESITDDRDDDQDADESGRGEFDSKSGWGIED